MTSDAPPRRPARARWRTIALATILAIYFAGYVAQRASGRLRAVPHDPTGTIHLQHGYENIDRDALPVMICDGSLRLTLVQGRTYRPPHTALTWAFAPLIAAEELLRGH